MKSAPKTALKTGLLKTAMAACAAIALASLGGCGGQPAAAAPKIGPDGKPVAPAVMPKIKTGKWNVRSTVDGKRGEPDEICISDESVEKLAQTAPMIGKGCTRNEVKLEDGVVVARSYCKAGKTRVTSTIKVTGNFKTGYQMEARQTMSPPLKGKSQSITNLAASRIGDC